MRGAGPMGVVALLALAGVVGCNDPGVVASDCALDAGIVCQRAGGGRPGGAFAGGADPPRFMDAGLIRSGPVQRLDLLLVVDTSESMREERLALADQLPSLLGAIARGDVDGSGSPEFRPVTDIHAAIVSSDLGIGDSSGSCLGDGEGARLLQDSPELAPGCPAGPRPYVSSAGASAGDPSSVDALGQSLACWVRALETGCRIEQPLEAARRALIRELSPPAPLPSPDADRFSRDDALLLVLVLADEDDCSASNAPGLAGVSSTVNACAVRPDALRDPGLLAAELRALRANAPDLTMLAVYAGVPIDRVDVAARLAYPMESSAGRSDFYAALLGDVRMGQVLDTGPTEVPGDVVGWTPACERDGLRGYPALRLVEAVQLFGAQGVVQSLCDPDGWQLIAHTVGRRLGSPER